MTQTPTLPDALILIRDDRQRELDKSKIPDFVRSINSIGLINPVTVRQDRVTGEYWLIAGLHRLTAWRLSDKASQPIPVRFVDDDDPDTVFLVEFEENAMRVHLKPSEQLKSGLRAEPIYKRRALKRQLEHGGTKRGTTSQHQGEKGRVRDLVGAGLGIGGRTWDRMKAIGEAAEQDPARNGDLIELMDKVGVTLALKELNERRATKSPRLPVPVSGETASPQALRAIRLTAVELYALVEKEYRARGLIAEGESVRTVEQVYHEDQLAPRYAVLLALTKPDDGIREIPPDLVEAIRGRHFVSLPMPHLGAEGGPVTICTCDCGAEFRAPYGESQAERIAGLNEINRQVEAHWRAALAGDSGVAGEAAS